MNADQNVDGLFSSALPLTRSDSTLSRNLSTMYEMGNLEININRPHISTTLSPTRFNRVLSRSLATIFTHVQLCYERNWPCYQRDQPKTSITPLL